MTDSQKIPVWFWIISAILLIWNLMGVMSFFGQLNMTEEAFAAMPEAERAFQIESRENFPAWAWAGYAIAVFAGAIGGLLLLLRKQLAKHAFILSIVGVIVQFAHNYSWIVKGMDIYGGGIWILPILIFLLGFFAIWFSNDSIKRGWLS